VAERAATQAKASLSDEVSLWRVAEGTGIAGVIDAATNCLVAGLDSPALRVLAGTPASESSFAVEPVIVETLDELGLMDVDGSDAEVGALRAMCRRFLAGNISARELTSWAHGNIGHDGATPCQPLVNLDDEYDTNDYLLALPSLLSAAPGESLHEAVRREANALLASTP
jgi:hypothetical protein